MNTDKTKKITVLIRCANAGSVVEKTLASGLAGAFSQHIPAWRPSATPYFLPKISDEAHRRAICVAEWAMGFENPVQARLRRGLKAQRQLGSPKHSPAHLCPSV
jgi:hypothetical protein